MMLVNTIFNVVFKLESNLEYENRVHLRGVLKLVVSWTQILR